MKWTFIVSRNPFFWFHFDIEEKLFIGYLLQKMPTVSNSFYRNKTQIFQCMLWTLFIVAEILLKPKSSNIFWKGL